MPSSWSKKRERQYEHIAASERKAGRSKKRAKAIAAATVNKTRREKGETKGKRSPARRGGSSQSARSRRTKRTPRSRSTRRTRAER